MKFTKPIAMACFLGLVWTPLAATAASGNKALRVCGEAIAKHMANVDNVQRSLTIDFENCEAGGTLNRREKFYMTAQSPSGETIARFECLVNNWAHVQELRQVPLTAEDWPLLSQY